MRKPLYTLSPHPCQRLDREIKFNRLKHRYFEAAAGGYEYHMSLTPDAEAVARRGPDILKVYLWRRGVFAVQYANMSKQAIEEAIALRREKGYPGGMPPGAMIDEADAVRRFESGEVNYLKQLEGEPLLVMMERGEKRAFTQREITSRCIGAIFTRLRRCCFQAWLWSSKLHAA